MQAVENKEREELYVRNNLIPPCFSVQLFVGSAGLDSVYFKFFRTACIRTYPSKPMHDRKVFSYFNTSAGLNTLRKGFFSEKSHRKFALFIGRLIPRWH